MGWDRMGLIADWVVRSWLGVHALTKRTRGTSHANERGCGLGYYFVDENARVWLRLGCQRNAKIAYKPKGDGGVAVGRGMGWTVEDGLNARYFCGVGVLQGWGE